MGPDRSSSSSEQSTFLSESFLDAISLPLVLADADSKRIIKSNEAMEQLVEQPSEELHGRPLHEVHPTATDYQEELSKGIGERQRPGNSPHVVETARGEHRQVDVTTEYVDDDGQSFIVRTFDPIVRGDGDHARTRQTSLFEKTQQIANIGAWEYDVRNDDLWWSTYVTELFDYEPNATPQFRTVLEQIHPDDRATFETAFESTVEGGEPYDIELRIVTNAGEKRWVRTKGEPQYYNGDVVRARGTVQDITKRKQRERTHRRFRRAIEAAGPAIFLTERDGTITYANAAFEEVTGYPVQEAIGKTPTLLNSGRMPESYFEEQWSTILSGEVWEEQIVNRDKSGQPYHAHQTIAPITEDETVDGFVAIQTDITERKEQEQQLNTLDRVLRHNLRNELNIIDGHADAVRKADPDSVGEHIDRIHERTERLLETARKGRKVTQILSETAQLKPVDIVDVVERTATTAQEANPDSHISLEVPDRAVVTATERVSEAIAELLENAIIHSDRAKPAIDIDVRRRDETVQIAVADNGPGIAEMEQQILEETKREKDLKHGSGFGLWFVHWVIRRSHGTLTFEENEPRGSIVTIELPQAVSGD